MDFTSKSTAALVSLFAALPVTILITLAIWQLLIAANGGAALQGSQVAQALFAGFAFGAAVFTFLFATFNREA